MMARVPWRRVIHVNAACGLWAFQVDGNGTIKIWDPRSQNNRCPCATTRPRRMVGITVLPGVEGEGSPVLSVTALASRSGGLLYAVGTSALCVERPDLRG